ALVSHNKKKLIASDGDFLCCLCQDTTLFILPYDQKLTREGWFALKCKISEHKIKFREKMGSPNANNQTRTRLFDQKFSELFKDKVLCMRISQIVNLKNELTATVDLYFLPHQIKHLLKIKDQQIHQLKSNINKSNVNCVQFVLDQIKQFEQTHTMCSFQFMQTVTALPRKIIKFSLQNVTYCNNFLTPKINGLQ
ncbi:hypothetical protein BpHYR1_006577, partial [Brachionus plicatilis]